VRLLKLDHNTSPLPQGEAVSLEQMRRLIQEELSKQLDGEALGSLLISSVTDTVCDILWSKSLIIY